MRFTVEIPDIRRQIGLARQQYEKDIRRAALVSTDRQSKQGQRRIQAKIKAVGLGRLGGAVGQTSALKRRQTGRKDNPYGVVFARGGDESQGGGVLEAYSRGADIRPRRGEWLWISTRAVPRYVSMGGRRMRLTPEIYRASGLVAKLGPLVFIQKSSNRAVYLIKKVTTSPKTGRAQRDTGRKLRSRIRQDAVVAFVGIRNTRRAQRFDKDREAAFEAARGPEYMGEEMLRLGYGTG